MVIALIGFMGAGKSTIGRRLAGILGGTCLDTDEAIEHETGASISELFRRDGEPGFRALEHLVVTALIRRALIEDRAEPAVLALGGGAAMHQGTRLTLRPADDEAPRPFVVHLSVSLGEALRRIGTDRGRPVLADPALPEIHAARSAAYDQLADLVVRTDGRASAEITDEIHRCLVTSSHQRWH